MLAIILSTELLASVVHSLPRNRCGLKVSAPAELMVGEPTKLLTIWTALRSPRTPARYRRPAA
jgi:hypothetical protein